jgi:hypothetical protein
MLAASLPPVRSPRQCIGPWLAMPRRLCVVMGPFIGCSVGSTGVCVMGLKSGIANGPGLASGSPSGLPRSHARLSVSPKAWQLAQAESPWLELFRAS